ncbi:nicotinate-nucleotide adenylyltransferase [Colwellia sp. RE-S-Sl-9]
MNTSENIKDKALKIGILGGTFDPIHKGHIEPAKQVIKQFSLDKVLVIPAHKPPHKNSTNASTEHRVNMAKLVCKKEPFFELDIREIKRSTLSYTIDTLKEIKAEYPTSELYFIMGMDSLLSFTTWYLWQEILQQCHLIVNTRPGYDLSTINNESKKLLATHQYLSSSADITTDNNAVKKSGYIFLHNCDDVNISSTEIRKNLVNNLDCSQWLPSDIIEYINANQLYRNK